ncbi:MAG: hypothetical protein WBG90_00920 [Saonia sp.]
MKKRSLRNLKLEKKVVSNLNVTANAVKGGSLRQDGCPGYGQTSARPVVCKIVCGS